MLKNMKFGIDLFGRAELTAQLERITTALRPSTLVEAIALYMSAKTKQRYDRAASVTPYAPSMYGKRKRGSGALIPDNRFGIDTGLLYRDLTEKYEVSGNRFRIFSNLAYAPYIMEKFERKGPYAPNSVLFFDEEDMETVGQIVEEATTSASVTTKLELTGRALFDRLGSIFSRS